MNKNIDFNIFISILNDLKNEKVTNTIFCLYKTAVLNTEIISSDTLFDNIEGMNLPFSEGIV